jgi:hypothetical protein
MMEHHHHPEAAQMFQVATSPEAQATLGRAMFTTMSRVLRTAAAQFLPVNPREFVVQPRQMADGKALVLLNHVLPLPNVWTLLVMAAEGQPLTYQIYMVNEDDLTQTTFATLTEDDDVELRRQLATLALSGSRMFSIVQVPQPIEGYEYFLTEQELKEQELARLEAAAAAARAALESASTSGETAAESTPTKERVEDADGTDSTPN